MAHAIQPYVEPRPQLRTEAPRQRPHDDKYVSIFQSGSASADLTFRDPILGESADHFSVGVDELTVSLGNLSMLEYDKANPSVLLRVILRGDDGVQDDDWLMPDGPIGNEEQWRKAFEFKVDRAYTNLNEVLGRLNEISNAVKLFVFNHGMINAGGAVPDIYTAAYQPFAIGSNEDQLQCELTANGSIRFAGTRAFWANFVIEVPEEKYREIFFGDASKRFVSLHPISGAINVAPYTILPGGAMQTNAFQPVIADPAIILQHNEGLTHIYAGSTNILNTLDRRVTIEVSCSLPIKNSPMVDHGSEAPDFALARFMFHRAYTLGSNARATNDSISLETHDLGSKTLQGPRDRVVFHHLRPQQKIQTLRMRLWARVRTYDAATKKWGMKTIICPMSSSDYWHARLHFLHKDK